MPFTITVVKSLQKCQSKMTRVAPAFKDCRDLDARVRLPFAAIFADIHRG